MAEHEDTNEQAEAISDLEKKIIKQVEFYFGDKNFPRDSFLRQKTEEDEGWVTLECLVTFNRLRALSPDTDVIAKALRKSDGGLVEISEDNKKIRRVQSKPVPENTVEARQQAKVKTVYCKGFPKDTSLDQIEEFFADKGKVIYISMRRKDDRSFKGSVFVEFASVEDSDTFMALESDKLKFNGEEIIKMTRDDYYKKKNEERVQLREAKKKESKEKQKEEEEKKDGEEKKEEDKEKEETLNYDKGCVLHFEGVGEQTSREDLKSLFGENEEIAWVDFARGASEGYIRFSKEGGAQRSFDALKKDDGKVVIRDIEATVRVLEGNEEVDYWKKMIEDRKKAKQKRAGKFGNRGRGRGRDNKRKSNRTAERKETVAKADGDEETKGSHVRFDDGEPSPKKAKTEDVD